MARKPTASLPDVFAKPGQAPARGTPIEALPRNGTRKEDWAAPGLPPLTGQAGGVAASEPPFPGSSLPEPSDFDPGGYDQEGAGAASSPTPPPPVTVAVEAPTATSAPVMVGAGPPSTTSPVSPEKTGDGGPPLAMTEDRSAGSQPGIPPSSAAPPLAAPTPPPALTATITPHRGAAWRVAIAALVVSLTTPFWYDNILRGFGLFTAFDRQQQADTVAISAQERRLRDVEQRLSATTGQLSRAQSDLARAERQQRDATEWTRRMLLLRLSEALRQGVPFPSELAIARSAGAGAGDVAPLLDRVAPYAPIGVPTQADLERDFRRLTDPIVRPYRALNPMSWARAALGYIPYARSSAERDPDREQLREAAEHLRVGDIPAAAQVLRGLGGAAGELMAGWLADVDARAGADALIRRVETLPRDRRD